MVATLRKERLYTLVLLCIPCRNLYSVLAAHSGIITPIKPLRHGSIGTATEARAFVGFGSEGISSMILDPVVVVESVGGGRSDNVILRVTSAFRRSGQAAGNQRGRSGYLVIVVLELYTASAGGRTPAVAVELTFTRYIVK